MNSQQCGYLVDGCCQLAAQLLATAVGEQLACPVSEEHCARCLSRGEPSAVQPSNEVLLAAKRACPREQLVAWTRVATALRFGPPVIVESKLPDPPALQPACVHRGDRTGSFPCGCAGGGRRPLFACQLGGSCCLLKEQVERAAEYLRELHPDDRRARKLRCCEGCPDRP